jgi:hypothetical protein
MLVVDGLKFLNFIKVKNKNMNLSIKELNELIYSLGITAHKGNFCDRELNESLLEKLYCELNNKIADEEPEYDSAGFTYSDRLDSTLKNVLGDANPLVDEIRSHFVSNDEADEDYRSTLIQDSNRYESSVEKDYDNHLAKLNQRGYITQALLDYVDRKGAVSHGELETYYKIITGGSNSFSHILDNLRTPYKNRKTQRYVAKEGKRYTDALYVIKVANPSNWVVA